MSGAVQGAGTISTRGVYWGGLTFGSEGRRREKILDIKITLMKTGGDDTRVIDHKHRQKHHQTPTNTHRVSH
jgi:hypothetical protein